MTFLLKAAKPECESPFLTYGEGIRNRSFCLAEARQREAEAVDEGDYGRAFARGRDCAEILDFVEPAAGVVGVFAIGLGNR
jgi:hypothetical protein